MDTLDSTQPVYSLDVIPPTISKMLIESIERMLPMKIFHHLISFHSGQNGSHRNCIDVSIAVDIWAD
jgi:hypothetical protein